MQEKESKEELRQESDGARDDIFLRTPEEVAADNSFDVPPAEDVVYREGGVSPLAEDGGDTTEVPPAEDVVYGEGEAGNDEDEYFGDIPASPVRTAPPAVEKPGIVTAIIFFAAGLNALFNTFVGYMVWKTVRSLQQMLTDGHNGADITEKLWESQLEGISSSASAIFTAVVALVMGIIALVKFFRYTDAKSPKPRTFGLVGVSAGVIALAFSIAILASILKTVG